MSASSLPRALSALSLASTHSQTASEQDQEDWDRSLVSSQQFVTPSTPPATQVRSGEQDVAGGSTTPQRSVLTPRNSVVFPGPSDLYPPSFSPGRATRFSTTGEGRESSFGKAKGRRTLSELLRLHSEKGSAGKFSADEAARIADVLGEWINSSSSPYEPEDDFFPTFGSVDDLSPTLAAKKSSLPPLLRPRGRSESASSLSLSPLMGSNSNSRPPSSTGFLGISSSS